MPQTLLYSLTDCCVDKPKRKLSAYVNFCKMKREGVVEDLKKATSSDKIAFGDVTKKLAATWREMSDDEKLSFKT